jgi:hypothetical protein
MRRKKTSSLMLLKRSLNYRGKRSPKRNGFIEFKKVPKYMVHSQALNLTSGEYWAILTIKSSFHRSKILKKPKL